MNLSSVFQRKRWALLATAALAASAVSAVPASASLTGNGVRAGSNITVFHNIDFVAVFGYGPIGRPVTVQVLRDGVTIGSARGPAIDAEGLPGLEVNHGPEGAARPGDCWDGHTPDIKPGDVIRVTDAGGTDEVTVDNIAFTGDPAEETPGGDILVPFTAIDAAGAAIPLAKLDSAEFRGGSTLRFEATDIAVEPAATGGLGEYVLRYRSPFAPSRNREVLNQAQLRSLLLGDGHAIGFGHTDPLPLESMLHDGLGDTPGPAPGCESAPSATNGVTSLTPSVINRSTPAGRSLVVRGFSDGATTVEVQLSDADTTLPLKEATIDGTTLQTWRATFTADELADLDGNIEVSALIDGAPSDVSRTLIKDTVAPDGPAASLPAGTYRRTQRVVLSAGATDDIRYTLGTGAQAAPTARTGTLYRGGQIRIASTQTLKMIAIDVAGNVSPVVRHRYRILNVPSSPRIRRASAGAPGARSTAVARWLAPTSTNGARVSGYRVLALKLRSNGSVASRRLSGVLRPGARSFAMRLPTGRYRFQVRAINAIGQSPLSGRSNAVRAR